MSRGIRGWIPAATAMLLAATAVAQQSPADNPPLADAEVDPAKIEAALKLTTAEADKYEFRLADPDSQSAARVSEPLLRWSNPATGEVHGNVFLWTLNSRPVAVGSLFKWFSPHTHMSHEFHSLSESPLAGNYEKAEVWRTREGGLAFAPLADAPAPAASAQQRLLQFRRLGRQFSVTKQERDDTKQELRLLTQPLYRYAAPQAGIADGALFVFVQGTDPELFLLLEARGEGDAAKYHFAASRMNGVGFTMRRGDREVWSVPVMPWRDIGTHAEVYTSFRFENVSLP